MTIGIPSRQKDVSFVLKSCKQPHICFYRPSPPLELYQGLQSRPISPRIRRRVTPTGTRLFISIDHVNPLEACASCRPLHSPRYCSLRWLRHIYNSNRYSGQDVQEDGKKERQLWEGGYEDWSERSQDGELC